MRRFRFALVALAGCGLLLAGSSTAAFPGTNGKIVFAGSTDPNGGIKEDVFVINADGTGMSQLTHDVTLDRMPVFSPSGQEIAFTRENRGGNLQIYVMNADGSGERRLSNNQWDDFQPTWSPDGRRIAFLRIKNVLDPGAIYLMNRDGSGVRQLTDGRFAVGSPAFSPDGKTIAFEFLDATNLAGPKSGHMHHAVYTLKDPDHLTEEWTWSQDGKDTAHRFELERKKPI